MNNKSRDKSIVFTVMRLDVKTNESKEVACVKAITILDAKSKFHSETKIEDNETFKYWIKYPICR
jgi:hypothetical protein